MDPKEVWKKVFSSYPQCLGKAWRFNYVCHGNCEYWRTCLFRIKKKAREEKNLTILGDKKCIRKIQKNSGKNSS